MNDPRPFLPRRRIARQPCSFLMIAATVITLGGCASMAGIGGTSEYACKAPVGIKCDSVSGTYANAIQGNLPSQRQSARAGAKEDGGMTAISRQATAAGSRSDGTAIVSDEGPGTSGSVRPLRSQPRVLRLWIKPYEDADSDLIGDQRVYVRVDNGRWLVDHNPRPTQAAYVAVKPPSQVTKKAKEEGKAIDLPNPATDSQSPGQRPYAPGFGGAK